MSAREPGGSFPPTSGARLLFAAFPARQVRTWSRALIVVHFWQARVCESGSGSRRRRASSARGKRGVLGPSGARARLPGLRGGLHKRICAPTAGRGRTPLGPRPRGSARRGAGTTSAPGEKLPLAVAGNPRHGVVLALYWLFVFWPELLRARFCKGQESAGKTRIKDMVSGLESSRARNGSSFTLRIC